MTGTARTAAATSVLALLVACGPPAQEAAPAAPPAPPVQRPAPANGTGDRPAAAPKFDRARQLNREGDRIQALAALDEALALDPAFIEARMLRAQVKAEEGATLDVAGALADVELVKLERPDEPLVLCMEGILRFHLGQGEAARALLEKVAQAPLQPGSERSRASVAETLAELALRRGELDAADRNLDVAARLAPERATILLKRADVAGERGEVAAQERWLDQALERDPELIAAHHARALLLARLKRGDEAARAKECATILRELIDDTGSDFQNDHAKQAALWGRFVELVPGAVNAQRNWVRELARSGQIEAAKAAAAKFGRKPEAAGGGR